MNQIDYKKLKEALLNKAGPSGIMPLIVAIDSASDNELLKLAREYGLNISDYMK